MAEIVREGITIHYRESGEGPSVLLLHGGNSSGAQWRKICGMMDGTFRMITMDHYGHGGTSPWPGEPEARTHEAEAALVREVIREVIRKPGGPVHLVGHSFGGGIAMRLVAADQSGIISLTLIEPMAISVLEHAGETELHEEACALATGFISDARAGNIELAWERFIDANNTPGTWNSYSGDIQQKCYASTDNIISGFFANLSHATTLGECGNIGLPSLALYGEATPRRLRRMTEVIAGAIPGCALHAIPGAGHMSPLTHPEDVAERLQAHLARCA